jgi:S-adenosylmethionine:tRNA ribosyltransferase-isomerase
MERDMSHSPSLDRLDAYQYVLPEELIAQKPAHPRDSARLLVIHRQSGTWEHRVFRDLPQYLDAQDVMVANNTQVLRARLLGHRIRYEQSQKVQGGRVEFVMLEQKAPRTWEGLFHASAKYVAGLEFEVPARNGAWIRGKLIRGSAESPSGTVVVEFDQDPVESGAGELPLPHYIRRPASVGDAVQGEDEHNYQTIYSKELGSAAAPTAGLHFTDSVLAELRRKGVSWRELTLHVGLGTFRPVKDPEIQNHVMHEERYQITDEVAQAITQAKGSGQRIVAVGTTSVRTLESAWQQPTAGPGFLPAGTGRTSIFIRPGAFQFQVVDRLLTNFHLPGSTLLMLVSAFAGRDLVLAAYEEAVRERYRFFSYGDAMLIC